MVSLVAILHTRMLLIVFKRDKIFVELRIQFDEVSVCISENNVEASYANNQAWPCAAGSLGTKRKN